MRSSDMAFLRERHGRNPFAAEVRGGVLRVTDALGTFEFEHVCQAEDAWHEVVLPEGTVVVLNVWQDDVVPWIAQWHCTVYPVQCGVGRRVDITSAGIRVPVKGG